MTSPSSAPEPPATGLKASFTSDDYSVMNAIGGVRGLIESVLPTLLFVVLFLFTRNVVLASVASLGVVVLALVWRIATKSQVTPAISGAIGIGLGAFIAVKSGDGSGFYLPGLITNAVYAVVLSVSILVKHPAVGYVAALVDPRVSAWRTSREGRRTYTYATLWYAGLFALKVAVQAPLYFAGFTDALGIAKLIMGIPAFVAVTYVVFLQHRALVKRWFSDATSAHIDATPLKESKRS
ncbi:DUF3159 domain-containing protein [Dermabacter sp. Marseille-Q3180]|uniref:DUF3159 domain-containing protein n=1 Tax=Dermabacter sp. Marseille-Q3180 TaxID=2758090 RepID=UPI0020251816|nr:DUF3159 domain-containing protein [Dermabacter sp. Marseille-Q3180]